MKLGEITTEWLSRKPGSIRSSLGLVSADAKFLVASVSHPLRRGLVEVRKLAWTPLA